MARKDTLQLTKQYLSEAIAGENLFEWRLQRSARRVDAAVLERLCAEVSGSQPAVVLSPLRQLTDQPDPT